MTVQCKCPLPEAKASIQQASQRAKKEVSTEALMPSGKTLGQETLQDTRDRKISSSASAISPKSPAKYQSKMTSHGILITKEEALSIQRTQVEASAARFEPMHRFDDEFVQAAALKSNPGLKPFLITGQYALDVIMPEIDADTLAQIQKIRSTMIGDVNYCIDGVTCLGRSHILVTRSTGIMTNFVSLDQLESNVHVTDAEAEVVCNRIENDMASLEGRNVSSVNVDNAAASMAFKALYFSTQSFIILTSNSLLNIYSFKVTEMIRITLKQKRRPFVVRDPSHCVDLAPKDLAELPCIKAVLDIAKGIIEFVKTDRIHGIKDELMATRAIPHCPVAVLFPATRMYLAKTTLSSAIGQRPFLSVLYANSQYLKYFESRSAGVFCVHKFFGLLPSFTFLFSCQPPRHHWRRLWPYRHQRTIRKCQLPRPSSNHLSTLST